MTVAQIRLECLKLAKPDVGMPDVEQWLTRARLLEAYVCAGQGDEPPKKRGPGRPRKVEADKPVSGPAMQPNSIYTRQ